MKVTEEEYLILTNKGKIASILRLMSGINNLPKELEDSFADAYNNIESIHESFFDKFDISD